VDCTRVNRLPSSRASQTLHDGGRSHRSRSATDPLTPSSTFGGKQGKKTDDDDSIDHDPNNTRRSARRDLCSIDAPVAGVTMIDGRPHLVLITFCKDWDSPNLRGRSGGRLFTMCSRLRAEDPTVGFSVRTLIAYDSRPCTIGDEFSVSASNTQGFFVWGGKMRAPYTIYHSPAPATSFTTTPVEGILCYTVTVQYDWWRATVCNDMQADCPDMTAIAFEIQL
jgi:hypothetical protein